MNAMYHHTAVNCQSWYHFEKSIVVPKTGLLYIFEVVDSKFITSHKSFPSSLPLSPKFFDFSKDKIESNDQLQYKDTSATLQPL